MVAPDQPVPSQAEVDALVEQEVLAETAKADALVQANAEPVSTVVDGQRVWDVLVGDSTDDHSVAVWSFMPALLEIAPGDRVRFLIPDTVRDEIHTVSLPQAVHRGYFEDPGLGLLGFQPRCDPDGADEGLPGFLWPWFEAPCPQGTPGWVLSPWNTEQQRAVGDAVITPLTFPTTGTYSYTCNVHLGGMAGSIHVTTEAAPGSSSQSDGTWGTVITRRRSGAG